MGVHVNVSSKDIIYLLYFTEEFFFLSFKKKNCPERIMLQRAKIL